MFDPTSAYRTAQVSTASPVGRVVLLYEGAIRFGSRHVAALGRGDIAAAHEDSIRCQAIVSALQETLDLSAGPVALRLDAIYRFVLQSLVAGNVKKDPRPTEDALMLLRGLREAWAAIAGLPAHAGAASAAALGTAVTAGTRVSGAVA